MVKVLALSVFHKTPAATTELASAFELSQFGFFQRGTVQVIFFARYSRRFFLFWVEGAADARALNRLASQEFMKFFSKTCAQKNTNPMAQVRSSIPFF